MRLLPTPAKILMTTDAVGGVWPYAIELARGLGRRGVRVILAVMGPPPGRDQREEALRLAHVTLHEGPFRLEWMEDPWEDLERAGEWLLDLERLHRPELAHLNGYAHASLPWSVPVLVAGHSCVLSWFRAVKGQDAPPEWDRYRRAVGAGLRDASLVVTPTRAMLKALVVHYGVPAHSTVIPNGLSGDLFAAAEKEPFVLGVGRFWDEAKNARALVAAAPRLDWPVRLAGEADLPESRPGASPNVQWLGRLPRRDLAGLYARAAIFAAPAKYEPFGLSALEAALAGCALVLGDIPSLREVWGGAAEYVPPEDAGLLAESIARLIRDPMRRRQLARKALERATVFTAQRMADAYLEAYERLLSGETEAPAPAPFGPTESLSVFPA